MMNGLELYLLGQQLMRIGEDAIPADADFRQFPGSVRSILTTVSDNPGASIAEITERTGFPADHVRASVAKLHGDGLLEIAGDPASDRATVHPNRKALGRLVEQARGRGPAGESLIPPFEILDSQEAAELTATLRTLSVQLAAFRRALFNTSYNQAAGSAGWDIGRPQPSFLQLAEDGALHGRVLDVGCGTGEHALMAAARGLPALGIDIAPKAIALAERKAQERNVQARFLCLDALKLTELPEKFDTVLDSGLFHVFTDDERELFVDNLQTIIRPGGHYFLLCLRGPEPTYNIPRKVTKSEIVSCFADDGWRIDAIDSVVMDVAIQNGKREAWLAAIART